MSKAELIDAIAEKSELTKKDSAKALNAMLEVVESALISGDKIRLVGFGTLEVKQRAARKCRKIGTGEELHVPAYKTVVFRIGRPLKAKINE